jgi:tripartite-type tricarboxylate transporter receptor subunit TctC
VNRFLLHVLLVLAAACAPASQQAPPEPAGNPAASPVTSPATKPAAAPSPSPASASPSAFNPLPVPSVSEQARQDAEEFFRGKTARIIVGLSAGGGYDTMARTVARHLGKHVPGNPTFIVENQTGAAGAVAANTVFNTGPRDGTVLHLFTETLLQSQVLGQEGIQFDARQFVWLGSTQVQTITCITRADSGISSFQDLLGGATPLRVGSTSPGTNTNDFPTTLKGALGANIRVVPGYPGTNEIRLAMERGETNGACIPWESLKVTSAQWFAEPNRFARVLVQQGTEKHPDLQDVPLAEEFAPTHTGRQVIRAITGALAISKPFVAPPGVPPDMAEVLRAAFIATMNDPEFRQDAEQSRVELQPRSPEAAERIANEILSTPPDVVNELKRILGGS